MSAASISLVVPVYNVARYLPDFLDSLDAQARALERVEIVFVDDGSTDDSRRLIDAWLANDHPSARVVSKDNGGLASARNRGLDEVTGAWVSFPDPDDRLSPGYLSAVLDFVASRKAATVHLVAANLLVLDDASGEVSDTHPLRFKFAQGERVVDLVRHPENIHLQAASAFYRRATIERSGLRFDHRIRPNFEDAHLTALYLSSFDRPRIATLPQAAYLYRLRADGSSLVQGSWTKPEKYTELLEHGHLALLEAVSRRLGRIPRWVQDLVLYDLAFYFRMDSRPDSPTAGITAEVSERFHALLAEILAHLDVSAIEGLRIPSTTPEMRAAMVVAGKGIAALSRGVHLDRIDTSRRLVRLTYYFAAELPSERFLARGLLVTPVHAKTRAVRFLGATMLRQRIAWLPATGTLALELDGERMPLTLGPDVGRRYRAGPTALWRELAGRPPPEDSPAGRSGLVTRSLARLRFRSWQPTLTRRREVAEPTPEERDPSLLRHANSRPARRRYRDAWLLIDRPQHAQDNAERLYSYLRRRHRRVNAWFVLARTSSDWDRLHRAGFRLIEHGSPEHAAALMHCRHVISSHLDQAVIDPLPGVDLGPRSWHFTFLQWGVTKDDLSVWLGPVPIDLMITATPAEYESIVGDGTPYPLTSREVSMTGFPRHDRLLRLAARTPRDSRRLLLVVPTWRHGLRVTDAGAPRTLLPRFWESDYAVEWRALVESVALRTTADEHGWEIVVLVHPNIEDEFSESWLADRVSVRRFADVDLQDLLARAGALATDHSSLAFEMAYLERPVVYLHVDPDDRFSGTYAYRQGTWRYDVDGFGPIAGNAQAAADHLGAIIARGGAAEAEYAERMAAAFPLRDGSCSRRVYDAICKIDTPLSYNELYLRIESAQELSGEPVDGGTP